MTEIELPVAELLSALPGLNKILPRSPTRPVLGCVRIDRNRNGSVSLSVTHGDAFARYQFSGASGEHSTLSVVIPFSELARVARSCTSKESITVRLADTGEAVFLRSIGGTPVEERMPAVPIEEWPDLPVAAGKGVPLSERAQQAIVQALQCISRDSTRTILQGVHLDVSEHGKHAVVGTDGRHLFAANSFRLPLKQSVTIPAHPFLSWSGFQRDGAWHLACIPKGGPSSTSPGYRLQLQSDHWVFSIPPVEGTFPNWRQVIPKKSAFRSRALIPREAVRQILEATEKLPCEDPANGRIALTLAGKTVSLLGRQSLRSRWSEVEVSRATASGEPVTIQLNRQFLAKAMRMELLELEIIDPLSAMRFSYGHGRELIVMPLRPQERPSWQNVPEPGGITPSEPPRRAAPVLSSSSSQVFRSDLRTKSGRRFSMPGGTTWKVTSAVGAGLAALAMAFTARKYR